MKPIYDDCTHKWKVNGVGRFDTPTEAWRAISERKLDKTVALMISTKMYNDLRTLARKRKTSVSDVIRKAIKEVIDNG